MEEKEERINIIKLRIKQLKAKGIKVIYDSGVFYDSKTDIFNKILRMTPTDTFETVEEKLLKLMIELQKPNLLDIFKEDFDEILIQG